MSSALDTVSLRSYKTSWGTCLGGRGHRDLDLSREPCGQLATDALEWLSLPKGKRTEAWKIQVSGMDRGWEPAG